EARIPQAGMAVVSAARQDQALVARLEAAYAASNRWCLEHAQACGALAAKYFDMLTPEAVADSIAVLPRHYAKAAAARAELETFLGLLLKRQPATVGNKLPDAGFYGLAP